MSRGWKVPTTRRSRRDVVLVQTYDGLRLLPLPEHADITREVEYAFLHGNCHVFALALAQRTGWRVAGLYCHNMPDVPVGHVVCVDDEGEVWDVEGRVHVDADGYWVQKGDTARPSRPATPEDCFLPDNAELQQELRKHFPPVNLRVASRFVTTWLKVRP